MSYTSGVSAASRDRQLADLEQTLMQVEMKGSEADLAFPAMLNEQYAAFADRLGDADTSPTQQQCELLTALHSRVEVELMRMQALNVQPAERVALGTK